MGELPEGPRGKILAVAILVVLIASLWAGVAAPLMDWYGARQDRIATQATLARRMGQIAAELPELRRLSEASSVAAPVTVLAGASDAVAGAGLQQAVQEIAAKTGAALASTEALPAEQLGAYRRIGVRVAVSAPFPVLVRLLEAITGGSPRMLVNDLQIEGQRGIVRDGAAALTASMVVFGFRAGGAA